jgi:hypothetical protein
MVRLRGFLLTTWSILLLEELVVPQLVIILYIM